MLSELLVPRTTLVRSLNAAVLTVPYLWCYVRHRSLETVGDQSAIVHRLSDPGRSTTAAGDRATSPPAWVNDRNTLWFMLTTPNARLPGEARYLAFAASNTVPVTVTDAIGSALPEFCVVLPAGDVLDLQQYDDNIPLPAEVSADNSACINALFVIQFEEPAQKRMRAS